MGRSPAVELGRDTFFRITLGVGPCAPTVDRIHQGGTPKTSLQLPLQQAGWKRVIADGVLQDYVAGTLHPCTLSTVARLLPRVRRYGSHHGPNGAIDGLVHAMHVARVAERLATHAGLSGASRAMISLYARLHDLGELFGGDVNALVPEDVVAGLRTWQATVRATLQAQMGLPQPPTWALPLLKLADGLVVPSEIVQMGGLSGASTSIAGALDEIEATTGTVTHLRARLEAVAELQGYTVLGLAEEAHGLVPGGDLAYAFCSVGDLYLTVSGDRAQFAWKGATEARRAVDAAPPEVTHVVATRPLLRGLPADVYTASAFLRSFPEAT